MEELITEAHEKGSVTSGGPSRCGTPEGFGEFYMEICRKIYDEDERILGKIIMGAKRAILEKYSTNDRYYGPAVVWTLFGDPALRVKYPVEQTSTKESFSSPEKVSTIRTLSSYVVAPIKGKLSVYDILGRKLLQKGNVEKGMHITLDNGIYYLHFYNSSIDICKKIVILHK